MSQRATTEKIKAIKDEVNEFHPLLHEIFAKMKSLKGVFYTHGPNEMGADFILVRVCEELGDTEYIAVIAKIGKILQNHEEIERQIKECKVKRFHPTGKKEIYISEIWVVSNGTISSGAQRKIFEEYHNYKVKFLDLNVLSKLIDQHLPNYVFEISIHEAQFIEREKIGARERDKQFNLMPANLSELYLDQEISELEFDEYGQQVVVSKSDRRVSIHDALGRHRILMVEGSMGVGKSKLLNKLIEHYCKVDVFLETKTFPVFFHFEHFYEKAITKGFDGILDEIRVNNKIGDGEYNFLIAIDGLDETSFLDGERSIELNQLFSEIYKKEDVKVVITTRQFNGSILDAPVAKKVKRYELEPLTLTKILRFIEEICKGLNISKRLIEDLKTTSLFNFLPKTPIAAIILAKLINEHQEDLPSNLTDLYAQYTELSLGRWDERKELITQKEYHALSSILQNLSVYMLDNELRYLSISEAEGFFVDYLDQRKNLSLDSEQLFNKLISRSDLVSKDEFRGTFAFKHRSFAEFFYAQHLYKQKEVPITIKVFHPYWTNSYFFYVGLKRDCPGLLREIISLDAKLEGQRFLKLMNLGQFLLAGFESPSDAIDEGVYCAFNEVVEFYLEIIEKKEGTFFTQFSKMQLLGIFRNIMKDTYSFLFFKNSINNLIVKICSSDKKTINNSYILFLADLASSELGGEVVFDDLVELYKDDLPLEVQLAIFHETRNNVKLLSSPIKKLEKRMRKHGKSSRAFRNQIESLYDQPIKPRKPKTLSGGKKTNKEKPKETSE
ncbi:MAG: hypothetical protein WDZ76_04590 [Pseudohongiellaceae bacterium]